MGDIGQILVFLLLLLIFGYLTGTYHERKHYKSIRKREFETLYLPMVTVGAKQPLPAATETKLFIGAVVISVDPFKRASAAMRHMLGGCVMAYETLLDRGRREALLRLKVQAIQWGATQVLNVRFQSVTINGDSGNRKVGTLEVIAYGTAIKPSTNHTPKLPPEPLPQKYLRDFLRALVSVVVITVLGFLALGWIAERMVMGISMDTEKKFVQWLPRSKLPGQTLSGDKRDYLEKVLVTPLSNTQVIKSEPVKVHLLDNQERNAITLREKEVVVYTGLLNAVHSENELAFTLAHELVHLKNRDNLKALGRTLVFLVILGVEMNSDTSSWLSSVLLHETGNMTGLHYDRNQEWRADEEALAAVVEFYRHGGHALDFFERLAQEEHTAKQAQPSGQSWWSWLDKYISDHPILSERITHLRQVAKDRGWNMEGDAKPLPKWQ